MPKKKKKDKIEEWIKSSEFPYFCHNDYYVLEYLILVFRLISWYHKEECGVGTEMLKNGDSSSWIYSRNNWEVNRIK